MPELFLAGDYKEGICEYSYINLLVPLCIFTLYLGHMFLRRPRSFYKPRLEADSEPSLNGGPFLLELTSPSTK